MSYQSITILGNLTRDAEVRQVGQSQVAKIGVAVSEKFRKQDGTIGESTEFFDVEVWDKAGVYPYLTKGVSVLIIGQIKTEKWQDQSGQNREAKKVRAQVIQLCGGRPQQQAAPAPGYAPAPPAQGYAPAPGYQQPPQYGGQPAPPAPPVAPMAPPAAPGYIPPQFNDDMP